MTSEAAAVLCGALGLAGLALLLVCAFLGGLVDGLGARLRLRGRVAPYPVVGGFLAAAGLVAAVALRSGGGPPTTTPTLALGVLAGVLVGASASIFVGALSRMPTDNGPGDAQLAGRE